MPRALATAAIPFKSMSAISNDSDSSWLSQGSCLANVDETEIDGPAAPTSQTNIDQAHDFLKSFGITVTKPLEEMNAHQPLYSINIKYNKSAAAKQT